jgi:putative ABC transport system permease protein
VSILSTLKLAFRALVRNIVRTALTMLGIIFGIGSVIAMVAAGQGAQESVHQVFQNLGTNVLQVLNGSQSSFGAAGGMGSRQSLTWDDWRAMDPTRDGEISTIKWIAPVLSAKAQLASEEQNWNTSITGTTSTWFKIRSWQASKGELFDDALGESTAKVAVLGQTVATQLFPGTNPIGQNVRIQGQPYEVVAILDAKGAGPMGDMDDLVVIPLRTYQQKFSKGLAKYIPGQLIVSMTSDDQADHTMAEIRSLLRDRHKLDSSEDDDFRIRNPAEFAQAQLDSTKRITTLLTIVAAMSLLIGGIGVMNIMLVSVIERTREIGIRMAVGAKPIDVMTQFLVESLVLACIGGVLGLGLGAFFARLLAGYFGWLFFFPAPTAAIAFAVSGGVGVLFGLYPAIRASQLDPITALRYET